MSYMCEEPFGLVIPVVPFTDLDEVIGRANSVPYGLTAYAFTSHIDRARERSTRLEAGAVGMNTFAIANAECLSVGAKNQDTARRAVPKASKRISRRSSWRRWTADWPEELVPPRRFLTCERSRGARAVSHLQRCIVDV